MLLENKKGLIESFQDEIIDFMILYNTVFAVYLLGLIRKWSVVFFI